MLRRNDCHLLGKIIKSHGYKGDLIISLSNISLKNIKKTKPVFLEIEGLPVPFFIKDIHQNSSDSVIVSLDDVQTREKAIEYTGCNVYIKKDGDNTEITGSHPYSEITGFSVRDEDGRYLGSVSEIINISNNPLLRINSKKKELLIPLQEDFIKDILSETQIIIVNLPDGFMNIND